MGWVGRGLKDHRVLLCSLASTTVLLKDKGMVSEVHSSITKIPCFVCFKAPRFQHFTWSSSEAGRGSWHHRGERGQKQHRHGLGWFPWSRSCSRCISYGFVPFRPFSLAPCCLCCCCFASSQLSSPLGQLDLTPKAAGKGTVGQAQHPLCAQQDWDSPNPGSQCQQCWTPHRDLSLTVSHRGLTLRNSAMQKCCNGILQGSFYTHR